MTPVFVLEAPNNRSKYAVAYVTERTVEGDVAYDDVRDADPHRPVQAARRTALRAAAAEVGVRRGARTVRPRIAVTLGDPRGIGPEVVARALDAPLDADVTVIGADDQIDGGARRTSASPSAHGAWGPGRHLPRRRALRASSRPAGSPGTPSSARPRWPSSGAVDAIVTGPIHKHALHQAGFRWPGHTEWLAELAGGADVAMMLASDRLRVVLVTTHVALRDVPALVTQDRVVRAGRVTHAGAPGLVRHRRARGWRSARSTRTPARAASSATRTSGCSGPPPTALGAAGPLPADTVFVRAMRGEFDAVLAPYHDVGMTAIKVASFGHAVNVTLGLPFPRTSPDHGTAFDIAGTGKADPSSMRAALELAVALAERNED